MVGSTVGGPNVGPTMGGPNVGPTPCVFESAQNFYHHINHHINLALYEPSLGGILTLPQLFHT